MSLKSVPQSLILSWSSGTAIEVTATSPEAETSAVFPPDWNGTTAGPLSGSFAAACSASSAIFCLSAAVSPPGRL